MKNVEVQGIEPRSMGWKFRVLTTMTEEVNKLKLTMLTSI